MFIDLVERLMLFEEHTQCFSNSKILNFYPLHVFLSLSDHFQKEEKLNSNQFILPSEDVHWVIETYAIQNW